MPELAACSATFVSNTFENPAMLEAPSDVKFKKTSVFQVAEFVVKDYH